MDTDQVRLQLDGLLVAGEGLVQLPGEVKGLSQVMVRSREIRLQLDGLAEGSDGFNELPLIHQDDTETVPGNRIVRLQCQGRGVEADRLFRSEERRVGKEG